MVAFRKNLLFLACVFGVKFISVMGEDEVVVFGCDEEGRDIGIFDVFNRTDIFDIEGILSYTQFTFSLMVFDRKVRAIPEKAAMPLTYFFASYLQRSSRLENGESRTKQPI